MLSAKQQAHHKHDMSCACRYVGAICGPGKLRTCLRCCTAASHFMTNHAASELLVDSMLCAPVHHGNVIWPQVPKVSFVNLPTGISN